MGRKKAEPDKAPAPANKPDRTGHKPQNNGKHPGGAPPFYDDPDVMAAKIDEFFTDCDGEILKDFDGNVVMDKWGQPVVLNRRPYTLQGLAYHLGFADEKSIEDYEKRAEFGGIIKRARLRCQQYAVERLFDRDGQRGAEFILKCGYGWRDKDSTAIDQDNGQRYGIVILPEVKGE